jgi:hypothetical protein
VYRTWLPVVAGSAGSHAPKGGTHAYVDDPRNADVLIGIRDGVSGCFELVGGRCSCCLVSQCVTTSGPEDP